MSTLNRIIFAGGIAVLMLMTVAVGFWILAQRRTAAEWRAQTAIQQEFAEYSARQLSVLNQSLLELREDAARQRAAVLTHSTELRNEIAAQRAQTAALRETPALVQIPAAPIRDEPILLDLGNFGNFPPVALNGRAWGPEQATGEPNTPTAGDQQTAWASRTQDGEPEWLVLEYAEAVNIVKVKVYETYNPGALVRVTVFDENGKEIDVWQGKDSTPVGAPMGVSEITLAALRQSKKIKIYLDSVNVPGWNEIDAVGIFDAADKAHWAISATASSTYAEPEAPRRPPKPIDEGPF